MHGANRTPVWLIGLALLVGGAGRAAEPAYKGKTADGWARQLGSDDPDDRNDAVNALLYLSLKRSEVDQSYQFPADVQRMIARVIRDETDDGVRSNAVGLVADHRRPAWVPEVTAAVLAATRDPYQGVRLNALNALRYLRPSLWTVGVAAAALSDADDYVRTNAATALRDMGGPARLALPRLRRLADRETDPLPRTAAAWAVWRLGGDATEAVTTVIDQWVNGSTVGARPVIFSLLEELGPAARPMVPHLVWELRYYDKEQGSGDEDSRAARRELRAEALAVLLRLDPERGRPFLPDAPAKDGFPKFKVQEIAKDLKIGYAVLTADLNADKKPDIVVIDKERVVWYENPTWKVRTILQGKTKPDNVCAVAMDVDGGGDLELVVGAGWTAGPKVPATLQWLKRGKSLDEEWTVHPIPCDDPTVHRFRTADLDGDGKPELIVAPLHGRDASAKGNWTDGRPVRITAYKIPKDPTDPKAWKPEVISEELHVVHNIWPYTPKGGKRPVSILAASYEGYSAVLLDPSGKTRTNRVHAGNQDNPKGSRGASEIKDGYFLKPQPGGPWGGAFGAYVATIEPWHGNQVVVYPRKTPDQPPTRVVIDDKLRWGHAVWCADLDGDEIDELVIGVRDNPGPKDSFKDRCGVRVYKPADGTGTKWDRHILEDGGVAVEDLCVEDLNGDGKPDIVAVGRATGNARIYWNQGK